jgi:hypothetical protein
MLHKRKAGRVAAESYINDGILEARAMKEATRDMESYEYVFYTSKARSHIKGTNEYEFEYPGSWRTKTGKDCVLGIRALYLKLAPRAFGIKCTLSKYSKDNPKGTAVGDFTFNFTYINSSMSAMIEDLNAQWYQQLGQLGATNASAIAMYKANVNWHMNADKGRIELLGEDSIPDDHSFQIHVVGIDMQSVFKVEVIKVGWNLPDDPVSGTPAVRMWNREPLLITADFVHQTDNQHLGYTGCEFYPIKKYEIAKNTPYFNIRLWEDGTMNPVELPADNKDIVVVEAVIERLTA